MRKPLANPLAPRDWWTPVEAIHVTPALAGHKWKGTLQLGPSRLHPGQHKRYAIEFDNLRDLIVMLEKILVDCGGRIFKARTPIVNKAKLEIEQVHVSTWLECPVEKPPEFTHGFYIGIDTPTGTTYHNWFVHLEDLVQLMHRVAMDVQGLKRSVTAGAVRAAIHAPGG